MSAKQTTTRGHRWRWCALAAVGVGVLSSGIVLGRHESRHEAAHRDLAHSIEIVQRRAEIRRTHLAEVNELMLDLLGASRPGRLAALDDARTAARASVRDALERIAHDSTPSGVEAITLLDLLRNDGLDGTDTSTVDPDALFDTQRSAARDFRPPEGVLPDTVVALYDLMRTDSAGEQILNDVLDAEFTRTRPEPTDQLASYTERSEPYIRSDGGYLGPDPDDPLTDSYVYDPTAVAEHPLIATVDDLVAASGLYEVDQWVVSWQDVDDPGAPPIPLAEIADRAEQLDTDIRAAVDPVIHAAWSEADQARQSARARAMAWFGVAVLGGVAVAVAAFGLLVGRIRRSRARQALASTDRLTGAGNRHQLEERTKVLLGAGDLRWHLVAMVDMDRFKLINDSYGHAAGDQVLVEVANGLRWIADDWRRRSTGNDATVVRLGGDEFLLSLHGRMAGDVDDVVARLDTLRRATIEPQAGERIQLAFSVGIATTTDGRSTSLDDLLHDADLAAYDEKAVRLGNAQLRRRTDDLPVE